MDAYRFRICISYIITGILISVFIFTLLSQNIYNRKSIERLREEVDELTHLALRGGNGDDPPRHLSDIIDSILKKKLSSIWDDLYAVKKQIRSGECSSMGSRKCISSGTQATQLARINFASEQLGARICDVKAKPACNTNFLKSFLGLEFEANPPVNMIRENMQPGNCFGFKNKAEVTIKLAKEILIETVEIEHIPGVMSPSSEIASAPKAFKVYGIGTDKNEVLLGNFVYSNAVGQAAQQFQIDCSRKYSYVRFKFESNHGNPSYTCVYRVGVYGRMD